MCTNFNVLRPAGGTITGKEKTVNTYRLPTSNQNTRIYGESFLDAIENNMKTVATITRFDRDQKRTLKITHPVEEAWCKWEGSILGGRGGVVVIMRGQGETNTAWLEVSKDEWQKIAADQETITVQCSPFGGSSQLHDLSTPRVVSRNEELNSMAQELGFDNLSQMLTAWKNGEIKITIEYT